MRWPGSGLAAGELTPERPSGNRTTLSKNAHGPRRANGTTTGPATTSMPRNMTTGRRFPRRLRAAKRANAASGQAVNFMAETIPNTTPEANGCRRWASTMASSRKATTGMSSPPVASGRAAVGKMAITCRARILRRPSAGQRNSAAPATSNVTRLKKIRASVSTTSCFFSLGMPNTVMIGR